MELNPYMATRNSNTCREADRAIDDSYDWEDIRFIVAMTSPWL